MEDTDAAKPIQGYGNGEGVRQDIILAYVWFSLAASQGLTAALENRNMLKQDMSEELVENAQRLTREYFARYVEPYQPQVRKLTGNRHSQLPGVHSPPPLPAKQSSNKQEHHTGHSASGEENHKH